MPTPADFELPIINPTPKKPFGRGNPPPGKGRLKGSINRITRSIKNGIIEAAESLGEDGNGKNGLVGYLRYVGINHPKAFCHLLGKTLPLQINADVTGQHISTVNIVSVPSDSYLSPADIAKYRAPALIDHEQIAPPVEPSAHQLPEQEFEPQTESEKQLLARLEALSGEQLREIAKQVGCDVDTD